MESKIYTIVDGLTNIRVLAVKLEADNSAERKTLEDEGYDTKEGNTYIMLTRLSGDSVATYSPDRHDHLTMQCAHNMLLDYFDSTPSGAFINVRFYREKEDDNS